MTLVNYDYREQALRWQIRRFYEMGAPLETVLPILRQHARIVRARDAARRKLAARKGASWAN